MMDCSDLDIWLFLTAMFFHDEISEWLTSSNKKKKGGEDDNP